MDEVFFIASKTLGMLARVESWGLLALVAALLALRRGRIRAGARWVALVLAGTVALAFLPLAAPLLRPLETAYPANPKIAGPLAGIIVLGGAEDLGSYSELGQTGMNDAGERLTAGAALARLYPEARLIFTGGSGALVYGDPAGGAAAMTRDFWRSMGIAPERILVEDRSRNTAENAVFTHDLISPQPGQQWALVTSAFHMPRAVETFRRNGWEGIVPFPVDFRAVGKAFRPEYRLEEHLGDLNILTKEVLGLLAYRVAGK